MKILIAGEPESGQREVIEKLIHTAMPPEESLAGYVRNHRFSTKYFSADCGLWTDEYEDSVGWVSEFTSAEAREVRDALVLYIHTFDKPAVDANMASFVSALGRPGISLAIAKPGTEVNSQTVDEYEEIGFEVVQLDEVERLVHSAVFDALDEEGEMGEIEEGPHSELREAPRDLEDIMSELQRARDSPTMTKEQKMALAERLASELI